MDDYREAYAFFQTQKWFKSSVERREITDTNIFHETYNAIMKFFADKRWYCGGPVPVEDLLTKENILIVRNIDLESAVILGYKGIEQAKVLARTKYTENCDRDICRVVMEDCRKKGIAQNFVPGLFVLHLKLCEKVDIL